MIDPERIAEIKAAEKAATEGPWGWRDGMVVCPCDFPLTAEAAAFAVMARTAIPELLAERAELVEEIERLEAHFSEDAVLKKCDQLAVQNRMLAKQNTELRLLFEGLSDAEMFDTIKAERDEAQARGGIAESDNAALREEGERLVDTLKKRCMCEFNDGVQVSECHLHAVQRSGRRENGDPNEWRSKPEQFHGPHQPAPVDIVRADADKEIERLREKINWFESDAPQLRQEQARAESTEKALEAAIEEAAVKISELAGCGYELALRDFRAILDGKGEG